MTDEQITRYKYCESYLNDLNIWKNKLPFKIQQFGCGSSQPAIEFELEKLHRSMFEKIRTVMNNTIHDVKKKIDEI